MERIPERALEALQGVNLIIHAGDVNGEEAISELARIAPVEAVRGDHDRYLPGLPLSREVIVEGKRIVVVHGNRSRWLEEPQTLLWTLSLGYFRPHRKLPVALRRRFVSADAIVFGHTHTPHVQVLDGTLLFNPGGVHQWNPVTTSLRLRQRPGWFEWSWLKVARHMSIHITPSVGILEVSASAIVPSVISLGQRLGDRA